MDDCWVVVVGAGALQVPCVEAAHSLGLKAIVTDRNAAAPAVALADDFYAIDTYDHRDHRDLVRWLIDKKHRNIVGCFTAGADVAPTVAACAEEAKTPGIPFDVAQRTHNKLLVRHALTDEAITLEQPEYGSLYQEEWVEWGEDGIEQFTGVHYPMVIKPVEQCASRGLTLIHDQSELQSALEKCWKYGEPALIEEGLAGSEHSAEIILDSQGQIIFFNVIDRVFRYNGGIALELGHINPSRLTTEQKISIRKLLCASAKALGVGWGPWKCDLMWTADGPKILEVTARLSGGWDSAATTPLSTGRNPIRVVCCLACNLPIIPEDLEGDKARYSACAAAFPKPGRVTKIDIAKIKDLQRWMPQCEQIHVGIKQGDVIEIYEHNAQRRAFAITASSSYEEAWTLAEQAALVIEEAIMMEE